MFSAKSFVSEVAIILGLAAVVFQATPAFAGDGVARGSRRLPPREVGDSGEAILELWCKGGKGQFSVAGNTVIFVAGPLEDRACPPERAQADDELVAALSEAATWKRRGDLVSFIGTKPLRFRINTN